MSKNNLVAVRFVKRWRGYNPDEVAGFEPEVAEQLVDGGAAEYPGKGAAKRAAKTADSKKPEGEGPAAAPAPADGAGDPANEQRP